MLESNGPIALERGAYGVMNKIRFLHLPKTAGTSFSECLARIYPGERFNFTGNLQQDRERYFSLAPEVRERIGLVAGHSPRITGISEVDGLPTVTFLRDPIERVRSFCQHVSEGKSPSLLEPFPPTDFDLDKFLESGDSQLSNLQTKMLLGDQGYELPSEDRTTLVNKAVRVLREGFAGVGIVEQFDASLVLFHYKLRWEEWPIYHKLNVRDSSRSLEFSHHQISKIRELNVLDLEVYEHAVELFQEELSPISKYLEAYLDALAYHQDLWSHRGTAERHAAKKNLTKGWKQRLARAHLIVRTRGYQGLGQEVERLVRWLRA
jgi:hypothetical protein